MVIRLDIGKGGALLRILARKSGRDDNKVSLIEYFLIRPPPESDVLRRVVTRSKEKRPIELAQWLSNVSLLAAESKRLLSFENQILAPYRFVKLNRTIRKHCIAL